MTRVLFALLAFVALTAQRDPILVPEVSQHEIQVRQGFTGTELLLFGAILDPDGRRARVEFATPQDGVSPGQAAVFYRGDEVIGGGWIAGGIEREERVVCA